MTTWWERKTSVTPYSLKKILDTSSFKNILHSGMYMSGTIGPQLQYELSPSDSMNEVWPNVFLGNEKASRNKDKLQSHGITHVVNMAQGQSLGQVNTSTHFYETHKIGYLGIEAYDTDGYTISKHFDQTTKFMSDAIDNGGKVLVNCRVGMSRSATVVLAYLMTKHRLSVQKAIEAVRNKRYIFPNDGFLQQLCCLNDDLGLTTAD